VTHPLLLQRQQLTGVTGDDEKIDWKPNDERGMTLQEAISAIHACGVLPLPQFLHLGLSHPPFVIASHAQRRLQSVRDTP